MSDPAEPTDTNDDDDEVATVGWDAINAALQPIYGDEDPPFHFGTIIKYMLGGPDPIDGISVYRAETPRPHWHFVTYGFSELYAKESDDPEVSGWGFELTLRLARGAGDEEPPSWALGLLQNLGRYVFGSGNTFGVGHKLNARGPIAHEHETRLHALAFIADPQLPPIETPHGSLEFIQLVGITLEEHDAATRWDADTFLALLCEQIPFGITDLDRGCLLDDPAFAARVEEGIARDGSSQGLIAIGHLAFAAGETLALTIGASAVPGVIDMLRGRTLHQREFVVAGGGQFLRVQPGEATAWSVIEEGETVELTLDPASAQRLIDTLEPVRGRHTFDGWSLEVVPSEIRDPDGNVVETIG